MDNKEWLEQRKQGIGSSDIGIIIGVSPYKTVHKLWLEKSGQIEDEFKGNWATQNGKRQEPFIRAWYNDKLNCQMEVENLVHPDNTIYRASFDGIDHLLRKCIEIKTAGKEDHQTAKNGEVPKKYIPQCQWLMLVSDYDELDYISHNINEEDGDRTIVTLKADKEYQSFLKAEANKFWECVQNKTPPTTTEVVGLAELLSEYEKHKKIYEESKLAMDELQEKISSFVKLKEICNGFSMSWTTRKGSVKYKDIPELANVDLEKYRGEDSRYFTIKELKK